MTSPSPAVLRVALETGIARVAGEGVEIPPGRVDALARYLELLVDWSNRVNLVSRRELPALVEKHLLPSLAPLLSDRLRDRADDPIRVLDIGSGGGFPGVVIATVRPRWSVVLVESSRRKTLFLEAAGKSLPNVQVCRKRVERLVDDPAHQGVYALVTARAVAPAQAMWPLARPLLAPDGELHVYVRRDSLAAQREELAAALPDVSLPDAIEPSWHPGAILRLRATGIGP